MPPDSDGKNAGLPGLPGLKPSKGAIMKIRVEFVGAINSGPYNKEHEFNLKEILTVKGFLETLHFDKGHINYIQVLRNGKRCPHSEQLSNGDRLELMLMVGGG